MPTTTNATITITMTTENRLTGLSGETSMVCGGSYGFMSISIDRMSSRITQSRRSALPLELATDRTHARASVSELQRDK